MPEDDEYYKDYIFGDNLPVIRQDTEGQGLVSFGQESMVDDDRAFKILTALIAAEEGANIIRDSIIRADKYFTEPVTEATEVTPSTQQVTSSKERIWVSKAFNAQASDVKTVTGGRQVISINGPGKVDEAFLMATVNTIGMQVIVDDVVHYHGFYSDFQAYTVEDSHLGAFAKPDDTQYVLRVNDIEFQNNFLFVALAKETVEFDTIRVNYRLLVEI